MGPCPTVTDRYIYNNIYLLLTTTYVYSPGAGFDYDLTNHFAIKVDGQYQQWGGANRLGKAPFHPSAPSASSIASASSEC
jgi:hypothetical protein